MTQNNPFNHSEPLPDGYSVRGASTGNNWEEEFIEKGADLEHDRWSKWQKWMHQQVYDSSESINPHLKVIPTELFNRWERQIGTKYSELPENEKESDRIEVRKYLPLIQEILTKKDQEHKAELEMIRGEVLEDYKRNWENFEITDVTAIIDSHINKLSTE